MIEYDAEGRRTFKLSFLPEGYFVYRAQPVPKGELDRPRSARGMNTQHPR